MQSEGGDAVDEEPRLGEILLRAGVIDEYQLASALAEQAHWGHRLGVTLIKLGFVEERDLVRGLAHQLNLPVAGLEGKSISPEVLAYVPREVAEKAMTLPLFVKREGSLDVLYIGVEDPTDLAAIDDVRFRSGMDVRPVLIAPSELAEGIDRFYRNGASSGSVPAGPDMALPMVEPVPSAIEPSRAALQEEAPASRERVPAEPAPESAPASDTSSSVDNETRTILQAVTQLLLEKGIITRDELLERVAALDDRSHESGGS
jgi:type IV pilus assembly protein PilB